jgi:plasmid stabilization system protein ParE
MSAVVIFHRLARREYRAARQHYEQISARTAARFVQAVTRAVERIAENPNAWPEYCPHYRWVRTRRFPYLLIYRMLEPNFVVVVAVAHGRRRPGYWLRRMGR